MYKIGQKVFREFSGQIMEIVGFEPDLIENVLTQWEDIEGKIVTGKFMETELQIVED